MKKAILSFCISLLFITTNAQVMQNFEIEESFCKKEIIEDIEFILTTVEDVHPNPYHSITKEKLFQLKDSIVHSLPDTLSRFETFLTLRLITAAYREGHTAVNMYVMDDYILQMKQVFPIKTDKYIDDKFRVQNNVFSEFDIQTGDLILSINDVSAKEIHDYANRYFGDPPSYNIHSIISDFPFWLQMLNISSPFTIEYLRNGMLKQETVTGVDYAEYDTIYKNSHSNRASYSYQMLENNMAYIDFYAFSDLEKFKLFTKETFQDIKKNNAKGLIVDIRDNGGGNSSLGYELINHFSTKPYDIMGNAKWKVSQRYKDFIIEVDSVAPGIFFNMSYYQDYFQTRNDTVTTIIALDTLHQPDTNNLRFNGPVCVLIGPKCFSSAAAFTDAIKTFQLATLIGEPLETPANAYGDVCKFLLPNTKLKFDTSVKHFIRLNGNENDNTPIQPDIYVAQNVEDTRAGKDTVLEFAKQWVLEQHKKSKKKQP